MRQNIPKDYSNLCEFIENNRSIIVSDNKLLKEILEILDELLSNTETMSDLHRDTTIILSTIKIQYDALVREYRGELTFDKIIDMSNNDQLDEFFEYIQKKSLSMKFLDCLKLDYEKKERRKVKERTKYDNALIEASVPILKINSDQPLESVEIISKIKNLIDKNKKLEYFKLIINPLSFSRTVLNAFSLSLAIRMKTVSLKLEENILYVCEYNEEENKTFDHVVLEINFEKFNNLIKRLDIKNSLL